MRLLVDTNVFLDFYLKRDIMGSEAAKFFLNCRRFKHQIYISSMTLRDIGYVSHKYFHNNMKAKEAQLAAYEICSKVIGITADDAIESLYSDMNDYEDSLQVEAAKREMLDLIITNNDKDFVNSSLPVLTPKEFNNVFLLDKGN